MRHQGRQAKSDKPESEYSNFENSLKQVLSVSRSEMKAKIDSERRKRSKPSSASRVSRDSS